MQVKSLPQYTFTGVLHEGAETILHRGYRDADRAPVVVKTTRSPQPAPRELARLKHEYATLRDLEPAGVARVYGLERYEGGLALVMQYLGGRPLNEVLRAEQLDLRTALRIGASLANTLALVHQHRIIHRDIKPHNVIVNEETLEARLVDFGSATRLALEADRTKGIDSLEGTLAYISPEQTGRINRVPDVRSDLYSLGVTLYEVLTGSLPFQGADAMELVHSHVARSPLPPHQVAPSIPRVVSDIVMKLLAKVPEDRYQSARGLGADLRECLRQLDADAQVAPFPLGAHDQPGELRIPQRLYGRDEEVALLSSAFERAARGRAEVVLISGPAGIGKSALAHDLARSAAGRGAYFASGAFEQLGGGAPYGAIAQALRELIRYILAERADVLERWKARLLRAVGASGRLLTELVPESEHIIGQQPELPELGPTESHNRFALTMQRIFRTLATPEHPLVLFLDALQWADAASLRLLQLLVSDPELQHVLLAGALRDEELGPDSPVPATLDALRSAAVGLHEIALPPLRQEHVARLIGDALRCAEEHAAPLAEIVCRKTQGNPFFIAQLLRSLCADGRLVFDAAAGAWRWDLEAVAGATITDNVVTLMTAQLQRLPPDTLRLLEVASCIGQQFNLASLSALCDRPAVLAADQLHEALRGGFLVVLDPEYQLAALEHDRDDEPPATLATRSVSYRFLHERVQQAAYALLGEEERRLAHLRIGRLMLSRAQQPIPDQALLEILRHLSAAASLITDPSERREVARLCLLACRRVKGTGAHDAAVGYAATGLAMLDEASWQEDHEISFALHAEQAECEYLCGRFDAAKPLLDALLAHARTSLEKAQVHASRLTLYHTQAKYTEAIEAGRSGLAELGLPLPRTEAELDAEIGAELGAVQENLRGRRIQDLVDAPVMSDPILNAALKLLLNINSTAYVHDPKIFLLSLVKQVNISLKHGLWDASAYAYVVYGFFVAAMLGQYEQGYEFNKVGLAIEEKFNNVAMRCKVHQLFAVLLPFFRNLRETLPVLARAYQAGIETGDFPYLSYSCCHMVSNRLSLGDELEPLRETADRHLALMARTKDALATATLLIARQTIANLEGRTLDRSTLNDGSFDEDAFLATDGAKIPFATCGYYVAKLALAYLYEDHAAAAVMAERAEALSASVVGFYTSAELSFYASLAILAQMRHAPAEERARLAERLAVHEGQLARWTESCPANFRHKHLLVLAEQAMLDGREHEAMSLYERALEAAEESTFVREEALINERFAVALLSSGRSRIARFYLVAAYNGYLRWGATAKVAMLADRYPLLRSAPTGAAREGMASVSALSASTTTMKTMLLDVAAVIRTAQTLAGEIQLSRVLERLMRIATENAGAQKAVLLLHRDGRLVIEAVQQVDPDMVDVGLSIPVDESDELPLTVVHYVARTGEAVLLGDAAHEGRFSGDPYIAAHGTRSIMCLSMSHQARLTGVLYLENNVTTGAFTPARLDLLGLLLMQAATAVENAQLYEHVQRRTEELRSAEERLKVELTERERTEQARAALQEEIIRVQQARLAELSTPLIPIAEGVMVMPLIGTMDAQRAAQVLDTALQGVQSRQARAVILDITGVKIVDSDVASTLMRTATALRLLGAQTIITGIRPEVARTLVSLEVDMSSIVTKGTLESGIAHALGRFSGGGASGPGRAHGASSGRVARRL